MAKKSKYDPEGYGPNPADLIPTDEGGVRQSRGRAQKNASSSKAERSRVELRKKALPTKAAKRAAVRKLLDEIKRTGRIPASPTK